MTPVLFDPAREGCATLATLHATAFADPWTEASIAGLLTTPGAFAFHLQDGFVLIRAAGDEAEILTLAVTPPARGQGIGRTLLQAAAQHAADMGVRTLFLEVGVDNPAALALYAGLGFVKTGRRKEYYGAGHAAGSDALVMKVQLPLPPPGDFA
jgi:ribosomal-protein-alanine N-acetyltransferase